jgi:hypothetical protein
VGVACIAEGNECASKQSQAGRASRISSTAEEKREIGKGKGRKMGWAWETVVDLTCEKMTRRGISID